LSAQSTTVASSISSVLSGRRIRLSVLLAAQGHGQSPRPREDP
jgi:hypothetical protein